jgi:large subunit ribosomal protein L5
MARLKEFYRQEVIARLMKEGGYKNIMQVPKIEKIVINVGCGEAITNAKAIEAVSGDLTAIAGQKVHVRRATKSISNFKLRQGMPIGVAVTLRGERMYEFLDRMITLAFPRVRDFRGISPKSFDGRGNYTIGLKEQIIFPEIDYDKIDRVRGMNITIVTTAKTDEEALNLLTLMKLPFRKN